jgi:arabinogalactan endo-1,4-beta-galactosidase
MKRILKPSHCTLPALLLAAGALCHCGTHDPAPSAPSAASGAALPQAPSTPGDDEGSTPGTTNPSATPGQAETSESGPMPVSIAMPPGGADTPTPSESPPSGDAPPTAPMTPATPPFTGNFILGADLSSVQEAVDGGAVYIDTDGEQKDLLALLQNHGFNYVRLRTFVNPLAPYGYASASGCRAKAEAYDDRDHTVEVARTVKAAGMGFLLDFHYSDTWADPGKQVIPEAWRGAQSVAELATQVRAYTVDVLTALAAARALPDMVQVGNEITPGMLIDVPTANTDCYGSNSQLNPRVNGSQANWDNLATLLSAGIAGVRQVSPSIRVMLHIENTGNPGGVIAWVQNAQQRGVAFDVLGLSAYEKYQGPADAWQGTLTRLANTFPALSFAIAEYNPDRRLLNDIMRSLPDGRGLGTFFWEPTQSGDWGNALFTRQGNRNSANAADFTEYDQMRADYGL